MNFDADKALLRYFTDNQRKIENWFNIIAPNDKTINDLRSEIVELRSKNWREIL